MTKSKSVHPYATLRGSRRSSEDSRAYYNDVSTFSNIVGSSTPIGSEIVEAGDLDSYHTLYENLMYHPDLSMDQASYRSAYDHVFCDLVDEHEK